MTSHDSTEILNADRCLLMSAGQLSELKKEEISLEKVRAVVGINNYERGDFVLIKSQKESYSESSNVLLESLVNFFSGQQLSLDRSSDNPATNKKIRRI